MELVPMKFLDRDLEKTLLRYAKFPVIALLGPRQSGKTTLVRHAFPQHAYVNLDDLELRNQAQSDPKGFLRTHENEHGLIIDEFQNVPDLLLHIKVIVDLQDRPGYFVLTGSQNFLMNEAITQSLAGRVGILTLLPFSMHELRHNKLLSLTGPEEAMFRGGYPRLYRGDFIPSEVYPAYIRTYIERDVRQLAHVLDLGKFQLFLKLCAARIGQLANFSDLATSCGISVPTVHRWLSVLESSYILFLLRPYHNNLSKRVIQTPKIYFYDTGLACSLLEIQSPQSLRLNSMYGSLFEGFIISDMYKQFYNKGLTAPLYFWRDKNGLIEVDCLIERDARLVPIEIKAGETFTPHYFDALLKWIAIAKETPKVTPGIPHVVYAGTLSFQGKEGTLVPWYEAGELLATIEAKFVVE